MQPEIMRSHNWGGIKVLSRRQCDIYTPTPELLPPVSPDCSINTQQGPRSRQASMWEAFHERDPPSEEGRQEGS